MLLHRRVVPPEEQHLVEATKLLILLNLSLAYLKLHRPATALRYGEQALVIDQKNAKALFRCGQVSWGRGLGTSTPERKAMVFSFSTTR